MARLSPPEIAWEQTGAQDRLALAYPPRPFGKAAE
jgi:hypothetical protein